MNAHVAAARLSELPRIAAGAPDEPAWTPIRHALGIGAFGVNAWHGDTAQIVIEDHDESSEGHEELYLVLTGRASFTIDGDELDAPRGTLIALPPNLRRKAVAAEDETTVLALGAPRGEAFRPSAWERRAVEAAGLL